MTAARRVAFVTDERLGGRARARRVNATGPEASCTVYGILRDAAAAGLGVALLPTFLGDVEPALRRLVPEWHFGKVPVRAVWLPEARRDPRIRAVVEVMADWGRRQDW